MPASAMPFIAAIVAAFSLFIVVLGGVSIWTSWPSGRTGDPDRDV